MPLPKFWCIKINIIAANLALFEIIQVGYSDGQIVVGDVQLHSARCRTSSSPVAASHIALRTASQLASVAGNLMSMFHDIYLFILFSDPSVSSIVIVCCFSRKFFLQVNWRAFVPSVFTRVPPIAHNVPQVSFRRQFKPKSKKKFPGMLSRPRNSETDPEYDKV